MMRMNRTLVLAGLALTTVALAGQDGTLLRRTLKENSTDTYKIEAKVKQTANIPNQGEQETNITTAATYVLKTDSVDADKGVAKISLSRTVDSIEADGPAGEALKSNMPKPTTTKGTLDVRGNLEMEKGKMTTAQAMMAAQDAGGNPCIMVLPEKAVKVGDTWTIKVPKGDMTYPEDQTITAKLVGDKKYKDKDVWVISTTGTVKIDVDTAKFPDDPDATGPMANMKMHFTGPSEMTGETLVEKATGKTLYAEVKTKATQKIEIAQFGISIDATSTGTVTVTLKD